MAEIRRGPTALLFLFLAGGLLLGGHYLLKSGLIPGLGTVASTVPDRAELDEYNSDAPKIQQTSNGVQLPTSEPTDQNLPRMRGKFWAWNGHMSIIYANGGETTTRGSLMEKYGVQLTLERQDNTNQLRDELFACARELADGAKDCRNGIHFTTLMGDQLGAQLRGWNEEFRKLGDDLIIEAIGFGGRSDGEDAYLAPPAVKADPQNARGTTVAAAPREGDQNIVFFWAALNDIPVNVDTRTFDPNAINFWDADDFVQASQLYNTSACESRAEMINGSRTGKTVQVCVDSLTTWTPADVAATVGPGARGGLVRIFSTKENSSQMPNTILGIKRWNNTNFQTVVKFLAAVTEGGEQLRSSNEALRKGAELSTQVYGEQDTNFWYQYYLGREEYDTQGNKVQLGGSLAFTLADNIKFFGLNGGTDYFRDTYELFGGYMMKYYPNEVPSLEPYNLIANKTYLKAVADLRKDAAAEMATGVVREFKAGEEITEVSARGSWAIEFETGKATFTPSALKTLEELRRVLSVAQNQLVEIHGHTDNTGNADSNLVLSDRRARAVKQWLADQSLEGFSGDRIQTIPHGQNDPVADNGTAAGRSRNRRVEIVIGR